MTAAAAVSRAFFRVAGSVAPGYAARTAARLFLTPRPRRGPSTWAELGDSATPERWTFRGLPLDAWRWGSGPRVVLCHSWGGRAAHLKGFVGPLLAAGYEVVAFDGPAHGRSAARQTNMVEFAELLRDVEARLGGVDAMVGHSFGASSIIYALRLGAAPRRVALIAPYASSDTNVDRFAAALHLGARLRERTRRTLMDGFPDHADGWDLTAVAARLTVPALLVHDRADREIPPDESRRLAAAWRGSRLRCTDGLGHRRIVADGDVIAEVVAFLREHSSSQACRPP